MLRFLGCEEVFTFLGCYTAYVGVCLPTFWESCTKRILLALEEGTDMLSRNVEKHLPTYSA
jgi:hypothetical protein